MVEYQSEQQRDSSPERDTQNQDTTQTVQEDTKSDVYKEDYPDLIEQYGDAHMELVCAQ